MRKKEEMRVLDEAPAAPEEASHEPATPTDDAGASMRRTLLVVLVAFLIATTAAVVVGLGWRDDADQLRDQRAAADEARASAIAAARLLVGLDQKEAPEKLAELKRRATGDFAQQVDVLADTVAGVLAAGKVDSRGNVAASGVQDISGRSARVLLAATALVTNSELPQGELRTYRIVVGLTLVEGNWKISSMEFLS